MPFTRPQEEKVQQVKSMTPQDGQLDWAEFKKANPSLAGSPVIQQYVVPLSSSWATRSIKNI
ncbi:MAG: hypothetical protein H7256_13430 [Bdellovibrio sp.]|nr:hypothetical protein [Bdellovibrio sp.]